MPKATPPTDYASIPVLLRHARDAYATAMRTALEAAGYDDIPKNGQYVLGGLALQKGGRPLSQLIDELNISKQAAGQLVDALVVRGYLKRDVDDADRRKLTIALTERGRAAARVIGSARDSIDVELLQRSGAQNVERLRKTLAVLVDMGREFHAALPD
ncbi:MAG: MarR family transcriptional regulator [Gemmatimonadaceae bacterium]